MTAAAVELRRRLSLARLLLAVYAPPSAQRAEALAAIAGVLESLPVKVPGDDA